MTLERVGEPGDLEKEVKIWAKEPVGREDGGGRGGGAVGWVMVVVE